MTTTYTTGNLTNNSTVTLTGTGSSGSSVTYSTVATSYPILNGGTITTNGTSGYTWNNPNTVMTVNPTGDKVTLDEKATLEVKGKVKINGFDLEERLKTIERVLMIPERDVTMEAKYPSLKKKYDEYIKALEKYRMWDAIKGDKE